MRRLVLGLGGRHAFDHVNAGCWWGDGRRKTGTHVGAGVVRHPRARWCAPRPLPELRARHPPGAHNHAPCRTAWLPLFSPRRTDRPVPLARCAVGYLACLHAKQDASAGLIGDAPDGLCSGARHQRLRHHLRPPVPRIRTLHSSSAVRNVIDRSITHGKE
jgi:hypothetical protein